MSDPELKYNVTMSEHIEPDYRDGYAEGYARAWQECWDYFIEKINLQRKQEEELLRKEAEAKPTP